MPNDHPFQHLFETFGKLSPSHAESVNQEARETMKGHLDVPLGNSGHCILLRAPRAGHGKTHLLTRLQYELGGSHEFIPLHAIGGSRIDAATVLDDTLRRLIRSLPAAGGLTVLDLVARRLFSSSLQPLVNSGEVPCQDREGAINALRTRPVETFDFHSPGAVTAHWARDNFELLGPRLALELAQRNGLSLREVSFWVDTMFRFSATPIDNPGRASALAATVFDNPGAETVAHERLVAILGLLSSLMRVVLVADEIEGFSADESAALKFASFIGTLRQSAERVDVILSINQDVWESAFLPRLSGGLADRLSEIVVELEPLDRKSMIAVLDSRSPGDGERMIGKMEDAPSHARGLIKEAAETEEGTRKTKPAGNATTEVKKQEPTVDLSSVAGLSAGFELPGPDLSAAESPPSTGSDFSAEMAKENIPETPAESSFLAQTSAETTPQKPDFSAPSEPAGKEEATAAFAAPVDSPPHSGFSAEAAIAAFAGGPQSDDSGAFSSVFSEQKEAPQAEEKPEPPPSWPSPEVSQSSFAPAAAEPVSAPQVEAVPTPEYPQSAPEAPSKFSAPSTIFEAAPASDPEPVPPFQAAAPAIEESAPAFQAAPQPEPLPPEPPAFQAAPQEIPPASGFQIPQSEPEQTPEPNESTDRVDDLLRQFRERYGKG